MRDQLKITGEFHLKVFENGVLIKEYIDKNLVVKSGRLAVLNTLGAGTAFIMQDISFGSNATAPADNDTAPLTTPFTKVLSAIAIADPSVKFSFTLLTSENNGATIQEFGLLTDNGDLFARKTGITINKNNTISLAGEWTITLT